MMNEFKIESASVTNIGKREVNQDRLFEKTSLSGGVGLFCIADGMGGLANGEYAAALVTEHLNRWWETGLPLSNDSVKGTLLGLLQAINSEIIKTTEKNSCGTTCSLLFIKDGDYYIAHTGDSMIYKKENAMFAKAEQLTEEHAKNNKLTSCLGIFEMPKIVTKTGKIEGSCTFLLCSDGFYKVVPLKKISAWLKAKAKPAALAQKLVNKALKLGTDDNVSVITVHLN